MESVKYVACNIVHFFEIDAFSSHLILHISLTFHRRRTYVAKFLTSVRRTEIYNQRKWVGVFMFGGRQCISHFPAGLVLLPFEHNIVSYLVSVWKNGNTTQSLSPN